MLVDRVTAVWAIVESNRDEFGCGIYQTLAGWRRLGFLQTHGFLPHPIQTSARLREVAFANACETVLPGNFFQS